MKFSSLFALRILKSTGAAKRTTRPVTIIAVTGIALGVTAMLMSVMIVTGFRNAITEKATGFAGHIRINPFNSNQSFEEEPMMSSPQLVNDIESIHGVKHVQAYAYKAAILKTGEDLQGIVLKGTGRDFDWSFFKERLVSGSVPVYQNDSISTSVMISQNTSSKLNLKTGDSFLVFFIQNNRSVRKLKVSGIYKTGLSDEFDNIYLLCDLKMISKVNNWNSGQIGGYEIWLHNWSDVDRLSPEIYRKAGLQYNTQTVRDLYPQLFNWLELQNLNVIVIISLISLIAGITMISTMLIIVLEESKTIGILKTCGATDKLIGGIYLKVSAYLLLRGILIGNLIAFGLAIFQHYTGFFTLDEQSYYMPAVPVSFPVAGLIFINIGTATVCILMMLIPSRIISKINPVKVLRFA